jgi:alcohol dehydrogenase
MLPSGKQLDQLSKWVEDGKIVPVIDKIFSLKDAKDAYAYLEKGRTVGKIILHIKDEIKN